MHVIRLIVVALCLFALVSSCQDYESPGAVADESVWSHVPSGADDGQDSVRQRRQREVGSLEERLANLNYKVDRISMHLDEGRGVSDAAALRDRVSRLRTSIRDVQRDVASLRELYEQPREFSARRDSVDERMSDLESEAQDLRQAAPGP